MNEMQTSRRSFLDWFLTFTGMGWLCAVLYPVIAYLNPPERTGTEVSTIKVGTLDRIPFDSEIRFRFGTKPALLIRTSSGEMNAFIAVCTHLDCTVQYRKDMGAIWCACHNGKYDLSGQNLSGPPPRPLESLKVNVSGNDVYVSRFA